MTPRIVSSLLIVAIISVAAAVYGVTSRVDFQTSSFEGQKLFPGLVDDAQSVAELVVVQDGTTMTFVHVGEQWTLKESGNYPVHGNLVSKVVFSLSNMELLEAKTNSPARHDVLQLGDPYKKNGKSQLVILKDAAGETIADLVVGRANFFLPETTTGGMYVRRPGEDQAWLVRGLVDIGVEPRGWLKREIVNIPPENIVRVDVTQPGGAELVVVPKEDVTGGFAFAHMPEGLMLKSEYAPRNVAAILNNFVLNDVRRISDINLDLAQAYSGTFLSADGVKVMLKIYRQDGTQYMTVDAEYVGNALVSKAAQQAAEIKERTDGWAYIIPEYQYEQIAQKMEDVTEKITPDS